MAICEGCHRSALLTTEICGMTFCKHCESKLNYSRWKKFIFSSREELIEFKNYVTEVASNLNFSNDTISKLQKPFNKFIDNGFIQSIDGKIGQQIYIYDNYFEIVTSDFYRQSLASLAESCLPDDIFESKNQIKEEKSTLFANKDAIISGLMSGRALKIGAIGAGAVASYVMDSKEKEKHEEALHKQKKQLIYRIVPQGRRKYSFTKYKSVEINLPINSQAGYIRFLKKESEANDYFSSDYFFFTNMFFSTTKKAMNNVVEILDERIEKFNMPNIPDVNLEKSDFNTSNINVYPIKEEAPIIPMNESNQEASIDVFTEIRKYKELLDEGILTEEEFSIKKKELLKL